MLERIGRRRATAKTWPPYHLVCQLAFRVKAVHLGEVKMRWA
ncbi:MAG TPA: hypothetical protein VI357_16480 [Mycobacteriales bacterium]